MTRSGKLEKLSMDATITNTSKFNKILLAVYVVAAVCSQSVLDISTFLLLGSLILIYLKEEKPFAYRFIGIEWAIAGYFLIVVLGFLVNASPGAEWIRSTGRFSWVPNLLILIYALQSTHISLLKALKAFSILTFLPTLYSLASYYNGVDLLTGRLNDRITGLVNSATYHAHGNSFIFIFMAGGLLFSFQRLSAKWKVFSLLSFFLLGVSLLLTFTRGIWLSLIVSTSLMLILISWKTMVKFLVCILLVGGTLTTVWPKFFERVSSVHRSDGDQARVNLMQVNLQMWREHPLLGIGLGENIRRNREYWDRPSWKMPSGYITSHAHNQYLNVLSTTGIFGFLFFISIISFFLIKNIKLLKAARSNRESERFSILFICLWAQVNFLLACFTDIDFEYAKIRALIIFVWAVVIVVERSPEAIGEKS